MTAPNGRTKTAVDCLLTLYRRSGDSRLASPSVLPICPSAQLRLFRVRSSSPEGGWDGI
jgi:hypothetical protein